MHFSDFCTYDNFALNQRYLNLGSESFIGLSQNTRSVYIDVENVAVK